MFAGCPAFLCYYDLSHYVTYTALRYILPSAAVRACLARKYDCNRYVKHFTCWNQLLAMMFGQLSNRESLRDLFDKTNFNDVKEQFGPLIPGLFD